MDNHDRFLEEIDRLHDALRHSESLLAAATVQEKQLKQSMEKVFERERLVKAVYEVSQAMRKKGLACFDAGKRGWDTWSIKDLFKALQNEVVELSDALESGPMNDLQSAAKECLDVMLYAMFVRYACLRGPNQVCTVDPNTKVKEK